GPTGGTHPSTITWRTTQWLLCWTVRNASMLRLGPAPSHRSSRLPLGAACRPGGRRRRPSEARPKLLGHDLDSRLGGAVPSSPAPLLELAHDHDPAALG